MRCSTLNSVDFAVDLNADGCELVALNRIQGLPEIVEQIPRILDTDGNPHHTFGDSGRLQVFLTHF